MTYLITQYKYYGREKIRKKKFAKKSQVNIEEFVLAKDELSGADIKAVCTEAGMLALRERRMKVRERNNTKRE